MIPTTVITIKKDALVDLLSNRRAEVAAEYADAVTEARADAQRQRNAQSEHQAWYADIAAGLLDGSYAIVRDEVVAGNGSAGVMPPARPSAVAFRRDKNYLAGEVVRLENRAQVADAEFETALTLLEHAKDDEVSVSTGDYQTLLGGRRL